MKAITASTAVMAIVALIFCGAVSAQVELRFDINDTTIMRDSDTIFVRTDLESYEDTVVAFEIWLNIDQDQIFRFADGPTPGDALLIQEGTLTEDWDLAPNILDGNNRVLKVTGSAVLSGTKIPPNAPLTHLFSLALAVRPENLDSTGVIPDSLCPDSAYEDLGVTRIVIADNFTRFVNPLSEIIGLDSLGSLDTNKVKYGDGIIDLLCICDVLAGDADGSGFRDIDDAVYLLSYIFTSGFLPTPYPVASGDANCDCFVDIDDVIGLINYIFNPPGSICSCEEWINLCGPLF
jgi:hypothetical protein